MQVTSSPNVSVSADCYNMDHRRRGKALIINNENFSHELKMRGMSHRAGTKVDERQLKVKLQNLGKQTFH